MALRQMTTHTLDGLKGWPSIDAVDFAAKLSANVTIDPVPAGRCVHLNTSGEYEMGVVQEALNCAMPMFLFQGSSDYDVSLPDHGDPATEAGAYTPVAPTGVLMSLPACGAYELQTTEFEAELTAGTYAPGDPLTADDSNTVSATGGVLTRASVTVYATPVCGIVSRAVAPNCHGVNVLSFWPVWIPRAA